MQFLIRNLILSSPDSKYFIQLSRKPTAPGTDRQVSWEYDSAEWMSLAVAAAAAATEYLLSIAFVFFLRKSKRFFMSQSVFSYLKRPMMKQPFSKNIKPIENNFPDFVWTPEMAFGSWPRESAHNFLTISRLYHGLIILSFFYFPGVLYWTKEKKESESIDGCNVRSDNCQVRPSNPARFLNLLLKFLLGDSISILRCTYFFCYLHRLEI